MQIHVARNGQKMGPFPLEEVNRQLAAGTLSLSDLAWYEGAAGWAALSTVPGVSAGGSMPAVTAPASGPVVSVASAPVAKTEPLAILSLVFSVLGFFGFCCWLFVAMAVAGVVCGHIALSKIKKNPELQGRGLALAGVIVGYVAVGVWLTLAIFWGGALVLGGLSESLKPKP